MPWAAANSAILASLSAGALVVTPSAAASRQLRATFDQAQRARGFHAWEPANILSWGQWLDALWNDAIVSGAETRLLLNEAQEHALWLDVISSSTETSAAQLTESSSIADLARSAWNLACAWNAAPRLRAFATTHDTLTFAAWAELFNRGCERRGYVSRASLEATLRQHMDAGRLTAPASLELAGFGDRTPAQLDLLACLRVAGTRIVEHVLTIEPVPEHQRTVLRASGEAEELHAIAHWARRFIQHRQAVGQPARVGILLPDLDSLRPEVEAVFREVLAPELQPVARDLSSTPYEFASGQPLTSIPLIAVALDLARWAGGPLELNQISALLLSPYIGTLDGRIQSAQFDAYTLRQAKLLRPEVDLPALLLLAKSSPYKDAPLVWLQPLQQFLAKTGDLNAARTFTDWAEFLRGLAKAANWAGERSLTSEEFHATRAWDDVLDQVATLDFRGKRVPYAEALRALERQATNAVFTPPSHDAPVQIVTHAGTGGLTFDALVLARATEANFPAHERPNPLLSFGLQASLEMPGTSQPRAAARAQRMLDGLLAAAPEILITYAAENADGQQRLAPILADLAWPAYDATDSPSPPGQTVAVEIVEDTNPLPPLPSPEVHGGSRVLQLQAACGFRAFAEFRLQSRDLDSVEPGFDASESGNIVHRALDSFWEKVRTQDALRAMPQEDLQALLDRCIDAAVHRGLQPQGEWDEAYLAMQQRRLAVLLQQWLASELQRKPFEVLRREFEQRLPIGPLALEVRFDRIDRVDDGFVLVDYKTGSSGHPNDWEGNRPDNPQLPLYTLPYESGELKGLAFAKVRAGEMKWLGYQAEPGIFPASRINEVVELSALIDEWRATLHTLAHDFAAGRAFVRPKHFPQTCEHCGQRLLCRVDPGLLNDTSEEAEDAASGKPADG